VDVLKRYRNHPSLVMYMSMDEGYTIPEVYSMWRRHVIELDGTRFWIPSGYLPDFIKGEVTAKAERFAHFREDLPTGMNDLANKSYQWQEPVTYFRWVREDRSWMFKIESGSASLPPISSLAKFLPDLGAATIPLPACPTSVAPGHRVLMCGTDQNGRRRYRQIGRSNITRSATASLRSKRFRGGISPIPPCIRTPVW